jgi:hypothetical protein
MKVKQIASNMTELTLDNGIRVLFSYSTPVACELNSGYYKTAKKWSKTTSRHINLWLNGNNAIEADQGLFNDIVEGNFIQ